MTNTGTATMEEQPQHPRRDPPAEGAADQGVPERIGPARSFKFPLEFVPGIRVDLSPDYLIQGMLPLRGIAVLYGRAGCGKSFVALDAALHVAAGRRWAGRKVRAAGVIYVAAEGARGMRRRVVAAMRHHALDPDIPFALVTVAPELGRRDQDAERLAADIAAQVPAGFAPGLVILDTLARTMTGGDETGASGMGVFIENAERLSRVLGVVVMPIHHMGKDASQGMRGSSALLGAADALWEIDPDAPGTMRLKKMKDDADDLRLTFSLDRVIIGRDTEGDPITTCVVQIGLAASGQPTLTASHVVDMTPTSSGVAPTTMAFLVALRQLLESHGTPAGRRFRHVPRGARVLRQADLIDHAGTLSIGGASVKSRRSTADRHVRNLEQAGHVRRHGGLLWMADDPAVTSTAEKPAIVEAGR